MPIYTPCIQQLHIMCSQICFCCKLHITFISCIPQGERPRPPGIIFNTPPFQSTPPQGERHRYPGGECCHDLISTHAPTRGATAKITNIFTQYLLHSTTFHAQTPFPLSYIPSIHYPSVLFVHFFRCESPGKSMYASYSHSPVRTHIFRFIISTPGPPQFPCLSLYALPSSRIYSQDNRTAGCPHPYL